MKRGPVSLASKIKEQRPKRQNVEPIDLAVQPLWNVQHAMAFFGLRRTAFDEFFKNNPDLPAVKIGGSWRFDPASIRAWFLRKQIRQQSEQQAT